MSYQYEAYLRKGIRLVVEHCVGEDELARLSPSTMTVWECQAAAAALLESRGCRPVTDTWVWDEVPNSGPYSDYVTSFVRDEALW